MTKYILKCWIPAGDGVKFDSLKEAREEKQHAETMQPENIYEIEEVEEDDIWCRKCGKIISQVEANGCDGMCETCWKERN